MHLAGFIRPESCETHPLLWDFTLGLSHTLLPAGARLTPSCRARVCNDHSFDKTGKKSRCTDFLILFFLKVSSSILTPSLPCQCNRSLLYIAAKHFWWTDHTSVNLKPFFKEMQSCRQEGKKCISEKHLCLTVGSVWAGLVVCDFSPWGFSLQTTLSFGLATTWTTPPHGGHQPSIRNLH